MKKEYIYGYHAVASIIKNSPDKLLKIYLLKERHDFRIKEIEKLLQSQKINIERTFVNKAQLVSIIGEVNHQGMVAEIEQNEKYYTILENFLHDHDISNSLFLVLDGILDPHNLGACLRTANAAGVTAVIIPKDNAVGITPTVRKVACGATETIPLIQVNNLSRALQTLQDNNVWVYGTASEASKTLYEIDFTTSCAIVLGAEEKGMRRLTREYCDELVSIPMMGDMPSLNVSVATGVCLFEVVRQRISPVKK